MSSLTSDRPYILPLGAVARALGVSVRWLRAEADAGRLPHLDADKTILFDLHLVESIIADRARQGAEVRHG
jgi:hypothetical protein